LGLYQNSLGLCKKVFYGASRRIKFGWRHLFPDFASQNQGKDVSIQRIWGCVKSLLPPSAAEYSSERHVIFTISLREIVKMTCLSKHNSVRSAVKNLFTQPQPFYTALPDKIFRGEAADTPAK
jgi:hypothetical protein